MKGGKRTGEIEYVCAGTDRVKDMLLKRHDGLKDNPDFRLYVFGRGDGTFVGSFDRPWRRLFGLAGLD